MDRFTFMFSTLLLMFSPLVNAEMTDTVLKDKVLTKLGKMSLDLTITHVSDKHLFLVMKVHDISEVNEKDNKFTAELTISVTW